MDLSVPGATLSEDALTAQVWAPAGTPPAGGWPVWVFIHGGWLQIGNPGMTDASNLADYIDEVTPVVAVIPAYRLSVFGFLAGKALAEENDDGAAGNWGFWDQRMA